MRDIMYCLQVPLCESFYMLRGNVQLLRKSFSLPTLTFYVRTIHIDVDIVWLRNPLPYMLPTNEGGVGEEALQQLG